MSDIDFDELDKAVNTLMSDAPKESPSKTEDIKTLTIDSTIPDNTRPSLEKLGSTLAEVNSPATKPVAASPAIVTSPRAQAPSLATRRGGRFMDVVHPSSDMKPTSKTMSVPSRQGITVEPTGKPLTETTANQADNKVDNVIAPESYKDLTVSDAASQASDVSTVSTQRDTPTNDWPDPLEMTGYDTEPDTKGADVKAENATIVEATEITQAANSDSLTNSADAFKDEDMQPLISPFIADAKVEKRPLGGAPVEASADQSDHEPVQDALIADDELTDMADAADQLPPSPDIHLPPELRSDLMAIETGNEISMDSAEVVVSPAATTDSEPSDADKKPEVDSSAVAEVKSSAVPPTSVGPTSIPQQYHEEPSTSDEPSGSIYDTDSYHQPLAHPAKAKSGWLWIIWILLLLIVGGGGAVALYFVGII